MLYGFSMQSTDGKSREKLGSIVLLNDGDACVFGARVIQDATFGNLEQYAGWTMEIADGRRAVCNLPFPAAA